MEIQEKLFVLMQKNKFYISILKEFIFHGNQQNRWRVIFLSIIDSKIESFINKSCQNEQQEISFALSYLTIVQWSPGTISEISIITKLTNRGKRLLSLSLTVQAISPRQNINHRVFEGRFTLFSRHGSMGTETFFLFLYSCRSARKMKRSRIISLPVTHTHILSQIGQSQYWTETQWSRDNPSIFDVKAHEGGIYLEQSNSSQGGVSFH